MDYEYLEHTADAEFIAYGQTLEEAFVNAARATFALIIDPSKVNPAIGREVHLTSDSLDYLIYDWLSELLYLEEVDRLLFSRFEVKISNSDGEFVLNGQAYGEKIRPEHEISLHIKAVTYHDLRVEKINNRYEIQILLDI